MAARTRLSLLDKAKASEIVVLDVRPESESEYLTAHLPHARSIPLAELERHLAELPKDKDIIAYCRGPFCLMSAEAVELLAKRGYRVRKIGDGVAEWAAAGLPIESEA